MLGEIVEIEVAAEVQFEEMEHTSDAPLASRSQHGHPVTLEQPGELAKRDGPRVAGEAKLADAAGKRLYLRLGKVSVIMSEALAIFFS